ncbi:MAG TPA: ABC transporter substrate-binding protein [Gaiellaceae bacterium]|nr:ABC transporter substrate-binding protein [Gaiellaceae bacterium]
MSDLTAGVTVGGYRIESLIGRGSSGSVYLAHEQSLDRPVALKTLLPELAADEQFRERFLRESRLAAALEHPAILPIYAAGKADGVVYLAMRFVDGADLGRLIEHGPLEPERALDLLAQAAEALDAAHRRGLVHRDVKPGNILVDDTGRAYLTDFGLAKHASSVNSLARDSPFAGTIDYIAPEQARGEEIDGRTDVYSLGCVLYETLTGEPPFRRASELASVLAHLNDPPPATGTQLDAALAHALAKSPEDRPATATAFIAEARAALGGSASAPQARVAQLRTFLITDVRGYTRYTQEHGDEAAAALAAQFAELVNDVVSRRDGRLLELRGDEALVVFESARKALQAAVELQQRATELPRGIGIGLDAGEAVPVGRGYRGAALNTAARLCAKASPGEILASEGVVHLAGSAPGVGYGIRRPERLKGFERPIVAVEIHPAGELRGHRRARSLQARARATRRATRVAGLVLVVALAAAIAAAVVLSGGEEPALAANSLGVLDAASGKPRTVIRSPGDVNGFIGADDALWAIAAGGHVIRRVDDAKRQLGKQFALPVAPWGFAPVPLDGSLWATDPDHPTLLQIDPRYGSSQPIKLPPGREADGPQNAQGVAVGGRSVFVAYGYPKRVARYTPSSGRLVSRQVDAGAIYDALVAAAGATVWLIDRDGSRLLRLDPDTLRVQATARLHAGNVTDARVSHGSLWVAMQGDGGVWEIDRDGGVVGKVATGQVPYALATGGDALWVTNANSGTVTKIDPETGEATSYPTGHRPVAIGVIGSDVWVYAGLGAADANARVSGEVVRQAAVGDPYFNLDPVVCCTAELLALQFALGAQLMDYRPGRGGAARIVPYVARGQPEVRDGGRTWTFRIRPGFRFSPPSGQMVTAETFRYTLERAISPKLTNQYCHDLLLPDVVGEDAYRAGKSPHVSGITVRGDRLTISLVAPSFTLPARLAMPCLTAVPVGTPVEPAGLEEPIPSAGPYYVDDNLQNFQLVVKRNPNYGGDRTRGVDGLVVTEGLSPEQAAQAVEDGTADWAVDEDEPPAPAFAPDGHFAQATPRRYLRRPVSGTRFLLFNTVAGPLTDVRLRRAVGLAIDRRKLAGIVGGEPRALLLPPGVPGFGADTRVGPALVRARRLVGGRHPRLVLAAHIANDANHAAGDEIRKDMRRIGIDVDLRFDADPWALAKQGHPRVDMLLDGWFADYPDGFSFMSTLLDPVRADGFYPRFVRDPHWLARIRAAARTRGPARAAAYRRLDVDLARGPVPITGIAAAYGASQLFSARVTCRNVLDFFGALADPTGFCLR